ncbi:response regulator [Azospirillum halopraeferens]|uniref:response regulator n=1 Tax=Azospirillum halopraeferens TaxID=34010 RepID=UPI00042156CA|nr:response regulator [Azospirillum halopraeferens]
MLQNPASRRDRGPDPALLGHMEDAGEAARARAALADGKALSLTARVVTSHGRRWHDIHLQPFPDPASGHTVALVQEVDVTERHRMEGDLHAAREAAGAATRAKSEFLATASHELRTPLHGILSGLDLLREWVTGDEQAGVVTAVRRSAESLAELIDGILDLAALDAPPAGPAAESFDPAGLTRRIATDLAERAAEKGVRLHCATGPEVPPLVHGDERRIARILNALAVHALLRTDGGPLALSVEGSAADPGRTTLTFAVRSTGAAAFAATEDGLRLALARHLAAAVGGRIGDDPPPAGRLWFAVDVTVPAVAPPAPAPAAVPGDGAEAGPLRDARLQAWARRRGGRILVVDDSATNRLVLAAVLRKAGFTVFLAGDGIEAVQLIARATEPPELVLMDLSMPDMDGFAATAAIRALPDGRGGLPVVALTAHAYPEDRSRCLAAGMNDHVPKPVRKPDLLAALARWLP